MAKKLKNYWIKLFTVFCSLYLAPLSGWFMRIIGGHNNEAYAVTVRCYSAGENDYYAAVLECGGGYNTTTDIVLTSVGETASVTCVCPSDITKVIEYTCTLSEDSDPSWTAADSCTSYSGFSPECDTNQQYIAGFCTNLCEAVNTGYVLQQGSLQTYVSQDN